VAAARARFLLGLVAAERGDVAGVAAAQAALSAARSPAFQADAAELAAREALLLGAPARAAADAVVAQGLRRDALDYRGLSRVLAVEGAARLALGERPAAADLFYRAGQGAAARQEVADARRWLGEALRLGSAEARGALAALR
jgi:hypothetical protein